MIEALTLDGTDIREALFNDRAVGPVQAIQQPAERITRLHGILFDLDPKLLIAGNVLFPPADSPQVFYEGIRPVLQRHPLVRFAEVRVSGTGLHVIVWLQPAVEMVTAADQERWGHIVRIVQGSLPVDPDAPGITALTRPVGSTNSKNGATVETLQAGEPVRPEAVEEYVEKVAVAPFREVALPLVGGLRVSPCPVCRRAGTRLDVLEMVGKCYNGCSNVKLERLYEQILCPVEPDTKGAVLASVEASLLGQGPLGLLTLSSLANRRESLN